MVDIELIKEKANILRVRDVTKAYRKELGLPYSDIPDELLNSDKLERSRWAFIMKDDALRKSKFVISF